MATCLRFRFGHHTMTGRRTKRLCEICDLSIWRRRFRQKKWRAPQEHPPEIDNMDEEETISMRLMRLCQSCDIKASAQFMPESHSVIDVNETHSRRNAAVITTRKSGHNSAVSHAEIDSSAPASKLFFSQIWVLLCRLRIVDQDRQYKCTEGPETPDAVCELSSRLG